MSKISLVRLNKIIETMIGSHKKRMNNLNLIFKPEHQLSSSLLIRSVHHLVLLMLVLHPADSFPTA